MGSAQRIRIWEAFPGSGPLAKRMAWVRGRLRGTIEDWQATVLHGTKVWHFSIYGFRTEYQDLGTLSGLWASCEVGSMEAWSGVGGGGED